MKTLPRSLPSYTLLQRKVRSLFTFLYSHDKDFFNIKTVNEIICNEPTHTVAQFKDYLIMGDYSEFVQKYYYLNQSKKLLIKVFDYYESCSVIFPNYFILPESKYLYKNIQRKQRVIDIQQEQELREEQKKYKKIKIELPTKEDKVFNTEVFDSLLNVTETSTIRNILGLNVKGGKDNERCKHTCDEDVYEDTNNDKSIQYVIDAIIKCEMTTTTNTVKDNNRTIKGRNKSIGTLNTMNSGPSSNHCLHQLQCGSGYITNNGNGIQMNVPSTTIGSDNDSKAKVTTKHRATKTLTIYNFHNRLHNINTNTIDDTSSRTSRKQIVVSNIGHVNTTTSNNTNGNNSHMSRGRMKCTLTETNINKLKHTEHSNSLIHLKMEKTPSHKSANSLINTFMSSKKELVLKVLKDIQVKHKYTNSNNHIHNQISSSSRNHSSKKIKPTILTDIELNKNYSSSSIHRKYTHHNELMPRLSSKYEYKTKVTDKTLHQIHSHKGITVKIPSLKTELSLTKNESNTNYRCCDNAKFPLNPQILEMLNSKIKKKKSLDKKQFLPNNNNTSNSINKSNHYISVTQRGNANSRNKKQKVTGTKTQRSVKVYYSGSERDCNGKHKKKISISPTMGWNGVGKGMNVLTTTTARTQGNVNVGNEGKIKVFIPLRREIQGSVGKGNNNSRNGYNVKHVFCYTERGNKNMFNKK